MALTQDSKITFILIAVLSLQQGSTHYIQANRLMNHFVFTVRPWHMLIYICLNVVWSDMPLRTQWLSGFEQKQTLQSVENEGISWLLVRVLVHVHLGCYVSIYSDTLFSIHILMADSKYKQCPNMDWLSICVFDFIHVHTILGQPWE